MAIFTAILGMIITILFVVGTHEAAHFFVAKLLGVKVLRFSIGFGKPLVSWHDKSGTEYVIAPIPLGGYVRMLDESEENVPPQDLPYAYNRQPFYKKFLIVAAGPLCNLFCAFILYWMIFVVGFTTIKPIIGAITPHSIAADAGMMPNQLVTQIDNRPIHSWTSVVFRLLTHVGHPIILPVTLEDIHNKQTRTVNLNLTSWKLDELNPDPLTSLGVIPYTPEVPLIIGEIQPNSPAAHSSLRLGDKLIALNDKTITDWESIITYISNHPQQVVKLTIQRDGKKQVIPIQIGFKHSLLFKKYGWMGIAPKFSWPPQLLAHIQYGPFAAISQAARQVYDLSYLNLLLLGKILTGVLSIQSLGGPITIFDSAGDAFNSGTIAYLSFLAFLSIAIGVINILPIPGLDGGHLVLQFIEWMMGRAIPDRVLVFLFRLGFCFLFLVLIQSLLNDILRL